MILLPGNVLSADGAVSVITSGIVKAGVAESMATGNSDRFPKNHHTDGTNNLLNFLFHLKYNSRQEIYCILKLS